MLLRLTLLLLLPLTTLAQRYPIQATVTLTPPYSPYLTDLTASGAQRLALYLHVTDPTLSDYSCKLRLTIEGVGITLRTRPSFQPIAIPLQGGVPQIFYGEDLIDYFNPNNLDFAGLSRSAFAQTHRLPEGVYRFSIEVLDYNRGTVVSNKATATAWIILNDPPLLNLPRTNTKLSVFDPTNIPFTWTPRHTASPNAAFSSEYVFRLFELPATSPEPLAASSQLSAGSSQLLTAANQAVLSQQPLYETTLAQSQLVYGPGEPALIPGRWYAWQVQAIDTEGRDLFKNRGKSEVFVFQFGDPINMPGNMRKETANHQVISIRWDVPTQGDMPEQYRVLYKPTLSDHWYEDVTKERWHNIGYLKPSTTYDIKVRSEKGKQYSEYTTTIQAATTDESTKFQCGGEVNIQPIDVSAAPLPHLLPGDTIRFADFYIMVREAKGSNGQFEGKGSMWVKMFNGASIRVKFSGKINMLYELDGEYESTFSTTGKAKNLIDEMEKIGEDRRKEQERIAAEATLPVTITLAGEIATVTVNPAGDIVITKTDGTTETKTHPTDEKTKEKKTLILVDEKQNQWIVESKEGKTTVTKVEGGGLVLGPDGKTLNTKELRKLDKMILASLKKLKKSIEDYWAANNITPPKDKGPAYTDNTVELILCLGEHKANLAPIYLRIGKAEDTNSEAFNRLSQKITSVLTKEYQLGDQNINVPQEKVDDAVCQASVENEETMENLGCDVIKPTGTGKEGELRIVDGINPRGTPCKVRYLYHEGSGEKLFEDKGWYEEDEYFDKVRGIIEAICWLQRDLFFGEGVREFVIDQGLSSDEHQQIVIDNFITTHNLDDKFHENLKGEISSYGLDYLQPKFGTGQIEPFQIEVEVILFITTSGVGNVVSKAGNAMKAIVKRSADRLLARLTVKSANYVGDLMKHPLRMAYETEVTSLKKIGDNLIASGTRSKESVARELHQLRRELGVKYKDATPDDLRGYIYRMNKADYGDELGPTIEWLREDKIVNGVFRKGKSWDEIIESATRPGSRFNRESLLSRFLNEREQLIPILDKYQIN